MENKQVVVKIEGISNTNVKAWEECLRMILYAL